MVKHVITTGRMYAGSNIQRLTIKRRRLKKKENMKKKLKMKTTIEHQNKEVSVRTGDRATTRRRDYAGSNILTMIMITIIIKIAGR